MNSFAWLGRVNRKKDFQLQVGISLVFVALIIVFLWSLDRYWQNTLQPRLYLAAETQAKILAESQAASLIEVLTHTQKNQLKDALNDAVQMILIIEDPSIGDRFIRRVEIQLDYSAITADESSLDLVEGEENCSSCFIAEVPLISRDGELLGLATFSVSGKYFQVLSQEMDSKLFTESSITLGLLIVVWFLIMFLFYRLNRAKQFIEASDQAKTRFMANVTHELRTPLNAILGYTQLYKQDTEMMTQYGQGIKAIDRSADHLLLMINDILEFSRANEENLTLHPVEVDLSSFLNTLVEMTQISAQVKNLPFEFKFDDNLPAVVRIDDKRLRQVLLNLLSNAVKFTESGHVSFSVSRISCKSDSCCLRFEIEDSGIGIEKSQLQSIFIPFQQLDNAITRAEGTGLGLTISQKLVKLMGSKLKVKSEQNKGSIFWFELEVQMIGINKLEFIPEPASSNAKTKELILPDDEILESLFEHSKRHNILGIRSVVKELETQPEYEPFLEKILPYVQNYRFKELCEWLNKKMVGQQGLEPRTNGL